MNYAIDKEARLVRIVGSAIVTDDDMVSCIENLWADSASLT